MNNITLLKYGAKVIKEESGLEKIDDALENFASCIIAINKLKRDIDNEDLLKELYDKIADAQISVCFLTAILDVDNNVLNLIKQKESELFIK